MSFLFYYTYFLFSILPCLTLTSPSLLPPTTTPIPQPFIFTQSPYTVNYTHGPIGHRYHAYTAHHNFITAVNDALEHLQHQRAQAGARAPDPISGNRFVFEVYLDRQAARYSRRPRYARFEMEGRFEVMRELGLRFEEVGVALVGLLAYAELGRREVPVCEWVVGDLRSFPGIWVAKGRMRLVVPDVDVALEGGRDVVDG
ncbi:MAG: hypothetical protein Q9176_006973 [Flavoplaca citrina]